MDKGNFFTELKRRNVYKVAVAYAVVRRLLIQAGSILFPTATPRRGRSSILYPRFAPRPRCALWLKQRTIDIVQRRAAAEQHCFIEFATQNT